MSGNATNAQTIIRLGTNERRIANTGQLWPQDGTESCLPLAQSGLSKTGLLLGGKRTRRLHCEIPLMTQSGHRRSLNVSHSNRCDCLLNLGGRMKRREFIILVGSAVVSRRLPLVRRSPLYHSKDVTYVSRIVGTMATTTGHPDGIISAVINENLPSHSPPGRLL